MAKSTVTTPFNHSPAYLAPDGGIRDTLVAPDGSRLYHSFKERLSGQVGFASAAAGWSEDVVVEHWSLPPTECFKNVTARHRFVTFLGARPIFVRWNDDGCVGEAMVSPGTVNLMPQGLTSVTGWREPMQIASFEFSSALIERLLDGRAPAPSEQLVSLRNSSDPIAYDLACRVAAELRAPTATLYGEMLCLALAVHLLHRYGRTGVDAVACKGRLSPIQARRVLEYMRANLDCELSVSAIASVAGMSDAHFARAFRATFKEPPHRTVLRWRLERAIRLVARNGYSLAEAALAAGFCDQAHFTNAMRRHFGITPGNLLKHCGIEARN
jgi:AraC family transcriptional regulator